MDLKSFGLDDMIISKVEQIEENNVLGGLIELPLVCRRSACDYGPTCKLVNDVPLGSKCPIEARNIISNFQRWLEHFNVDPENVDDEVDVCLIRDLVRNQTFLDRCEKMISIAGSIKEDVLVIVDRSNKRHYDKQISSAITLKEKLLKERITIMNQLNSTRKDKADHNKTQSAFAQTNSIFQKVAQLVPDFDSIDFSNLPSDVPEKTK